MAEVDGSVDTGNPAPTEPTPPATPAAEPHFLDSVADTDLKAWAENKQFPGIEASLNSYRNLEKLMGADKAGHTVTLLNEDATPEQRNEFFNKLGRPDKADGYTFKLDDGADTGRLDAMRGKAHEIGISDAQFSALAQADLEFIGNAVQENTDAAALKATDAMADLKKEWGAAFDTKVAGVDRAAVQLGITDAHLEGLKNSMGPVGAMKFIDGLSGKLGDDVVDTGEPRTDGVMTPEQAKVEMSALLGDKEFNAAWLDKMHPGHKAAVAKKQGLSRMISGVA